MVAMRQILVRTGPRRQEWLPKAALTEPKCAGQYRTSSDHRTYRLQLFACPDGVLRCAKSSYRTLGRRSYATIDHSRPSGARPPIAHPAISRLPFPGRRPGLQTRWRASSGRTCSDTPWRRPGRLGRGIEQRRKRSRRRGCRSLEFLGWSSGRRDLCRLARCEYLLQGQV